ncbi:hypothetical protein F4802DRAFT_561197 [Xylaria palmicola]|nr:hypothetical protein F4802DRAFT_561197 [Xylaria palmicola]
MGRTFRPMVGVLRKAHPISVFITYMRGFWLAGWLLVYEFSFAVLLLVGTEVLPLVDLTVLLSPVQNQSYRIHPSTPHGPRTR